MTPERCLKCDWWNHNKARCDLILKGRLIIGHGTGQLDIETQPGTIPEHLQDEFEAWLVDAISTAVDSYPGWTEILKRRDVHRGCAAHKESGVIKEFGAKLTLVKPIDGTDPLKNLDANGLFKSDVSPW